MLLVSMSLSASGERKAPANKQSKVCSSYYLWFLVYCGIRLDTACLHTSVHTLAKARSGKLVWYAWLQRGLISIEDIAKWRFEGREFMRILCEWVHLFVQCLGRVHLPGVFHSIYILWYMCIYINTDGVYIYKPGRVDMHAFFVISIFACVCVMCI